MTALLPPPRLSLSAPVHLPFAARDIPPSTRGWVDVTSKWDPVAATVPAPADDGYGPCEGGVGYPCREVATGPDGHCDGCRDRRSENEDAS